MSIPYNNINDAKILPFEKKNPPFQEYPCLKWFNLQVVTNGINNKG